MKLDTIEVLVDNVTKIESFDLEIDETVGLDGIDEVLVERGFNLFYSKGLFSVYESSRSSAMRYLLFVNDPSFPFFVGAGSILDALRFIKEAMSVIESDSIFDEDEIGVLDRYYEARHNKGELD